MCDRSMRSRSAWGLFGRSGDLRGGPCRRGQGLARRGGDGRRGDRHRARHGTARCRVRARRAARRGSTKIRCARLTGERQGVRVPRNEGVTNHVSPRAVRRSSRGVRRSVGSGSCGRAVEHRKGTCPGCRGFRIGRRQHRWPRYGEWSASPAVSENPCTHESLSSGPGRPPPHLGLSAGVAKGRQNCRSRRRTGRRSQTRS